jgi:hypothetical protein
VTARATGRDIEDLATQERSARLRLEKALAPRTLTDGQQQELVADLKPLAGQPVELTQFGDGEAAGLGSRIRAVLLAAGWLVSAVNIGLNVAFTAQGTAAGEKLWSSLRRFGLDSTKALLPAIPNRPPHRKIHDPRTVMLTVGLKPPPSFTQ